MGGDAVPLGADDLATWRVVADDRDVTLHVAGELDISNRRAFAGALQEWADARGDAGVRKVLDLTEVTFLDSSALHELVTLEERHGPCSVRASAVVRRLLDVALPGGFAAVPRAHPSGGTSDPRRPAV
jgi:anti-anti-sigma factor